MDEQTHLKLKEIKQSFRLQMNGIASHSMRQKGMDYKLNWGVSLPQLREMATQYGKDYALAVELWKENIRECKILATLIMPPSEMPQEVANIWMEQTYTQEMAEMAAFNLYQYMDDAPVLAYRWIASDNTIARLTGYQVLACLFRKGNEPDIRGLNELIDQARATLSEDHLSLKHAVMNCMNRLCELGTEYEQLVHLSLPDFI